MKWGHIFTFDYVSVSAAVKRFGQRAQKEKALARVLGEAQKLLQT